MIAVDTNVLVYAHRTEMELHRAATEVLMDRAEDATPWALPIFCITEFMRVVTHRRVFNPPSTLPQAVGFIEDLVASPVCHVVRPGPGFLRILANAAQQADARGNLMFDAQIAAGCHESGIDTIVTNDRNFERFEALRVRYL